MSTSTPPAAAPPPSTPSTGAPEAYDANVKLERLTEHALGFRYLAMSVLVETPGVPADRVVVFDATQQRAGDLPMMLRTVVRLEAPEDGAIVAGAPADVVTAAVKKYSTVRGLTFRSIGLDPLPCHSAHHPKVSCYEGSGEYLRQAGMGGLSTSGRVRAVVLERGDRRALVFAFANRDRDPMINPLAASVVLAGP